MKTNKNRWSKTSKNTKSFRKQGTEQKSTAWVNIGFLEAGIVSKTHRFNVTIWNNILYNLSRGRTTQNKKLRFVYKSESQQETRILVLFSVFVPYIFAGYFMIERKTDSVRLIRFNRYRWFGWFGWFEHGSISLWSMIRTKPVFGT